jgi:hypothetical protein
MPMSGQNPSVVRFRQPESPDHNNCQAAPPAPRLGLASPGELFQFARASWARGAIICGNIAGRPNARR